MVARGDGRICQNFCRMYGRWVLSLSNTLVWPTSLLETIAFHIGIVCSSFIVLSALRRLQRPSTLFSGVHLVFRYSHIPLTLLYSSLTKLFLLLLLSIWRPAPTSPSAPAPWYSNITLEQYPPWAASAVRFWDEDRLDREWVVRNVLGGMAAGFGLRVVLDCHPLPTTLIIVAGWAAKNAAAGVMSAWVGGVDGGEAWVAYSIP